ncbi:hypothetical protein FHS42_005311 [Streptomyces zagrosensis]|uniref:Uncharacterized protein n=1 Tax=Streptomyces zagrosensis TaxID=1042984 RepID=A0A7W9V0I5_9ACTN|nr:hypothetical protein [Streptomyces zagrosensis]
MASQLLSYAAEFTHHSRHPQHHQQQADPVQLSPALPVAARRAAGGRRTTPRVRHGLQAPDGPGTTRAPHQTHLPHQPHLPYQPHLPSPIPPPPALEREPAPMTNPTAHTPGT